MQKLDLPKLVTGLALLACVIRPISVWGELPSVMASHFSTGGVPDGTASKAEFFVVLGLTVSFVLVSLSGSGLLIGKLPAKYLDLPHKDYWLDGRLSKARRRMTRAMWWMAAATALLCACALQLVLRPNVQRGPLHEGAMWSILGSYFAFTLIWTVRWITAFTPPDRRVPRA